MPVTSSSYLKLVDSSNNTAGTGAEALYLDYLTVPGGSTLDMNGLNVYVRSADVTGTIVNGTVVVMPPNLPPIVVAPIPDVTVAEDSADTVLNLANVFDEVDKLDAFSLSVAANTNGALVLASLSGTTLTLDYPANQFGAATITIRATDSSGAFVEDSFLVTVNAVGGPNQRPVAIPAQTSVTADGGVNILLRGADAETPESSLQFRITRLPDFGALYTQSGTPVAVGQTFVGPPILVYRPGFANDGDNLDRLSFVVTDTAAAPLTSTQANVQFSITPAVANNTVTVDAQGVVRVGGGNSSDDIVIRRTADRQRLLVTRNGTTLSNSIPMSTVREIRVWSRSGSDTIEVNDLSIDTAIHAGEGNDQVSGGSGRNLIYGGNGVDGLNGGATHDFLIGGGSTDLIIGNAGRDILVGGRITPTLSIADLRAISADWASDRTVDASEGDRLRAGVVADNATDILFGGASDDWFIAEDNDIALDYRSQGNERDRFSRYRTR